MSIKNFIELHKKHEGEKIVVCGCGMSVLEFKDHAKDFITIGVNDVPSLFDPTYSLVTDHPNRFSQDRQKIVNGSKSEYLLTCVSGWKHPKIITFPLGNKGCKNLDNPNKVDHFLNSPYTGINIAYKLGAKNIAISGVDFTEGHFYKPKDGRHSLDRMNYLRDIKVGYVILRDELNKRGVGLYNLSKFSKIDVIPYLSIEEFKQL